MVEEITTALSRLPRLFVIARNPSFVYYRRSSITSRRPSFGQQFLDIAVLKVKRRYSHIACWMISGGKRWRR
jgi:hypothetical protein